MSREMSNCTVQSRPQESKAISSHRANREKIKKSKRSIHSALYTAIYRMQSAYVVRRQVSNDEGISENGVTGNKARKP